MIFLRDVPIKPELLDTALAAKGTGELIEFKNKHGVVQTGRVLQVEWRFMPMGEGNGWFVDLAVDGDESVVADLIEKIHNTNAMGGS